MNSQKATDELTKQIDAKVNDVRANKKWRREYMKELLHDQDIRYEVAAEYEPIIAAKDAEIADKDAEIADKDVQIAAQNARIAELEALIKTK